MYNLKNVKNTHRGVTLLVKLVPNRAMHHTGKTSVLRKNSNLKKSTILTFWKKMFWRNSLCEKLPHWKINFTFTFCLLLVSSMLWWVNSFSTKYSTYRQLLLMEVAHLMDLRYQEVEDHSKKTFNTRRFRYIVRSTLSWRRPLSYRNQSIDFLSISTDWFLYDNGLRHERVNAILEDFRPLLEDLKRKQNNIKASTLIIWYYGIIKVIKKY